MRDIVVKAGLAYTVTAINEVGESVEVTKSLDDLLPIDRVVTVDNSGYVSLYDTCVKIEEDMIEKEL